MSSEKACVFCQILAGHLPASFVYRDELVSAFLDLHPINPGHVLVIPNEHCERLSDLQDEHSAKLLTVGKRILRAIEASSLRCEGAQIFISDGEMAGQEVPHTHLHIVPRFDGDSKSRKKTLDVATRESLDGIAGEIREGLLITQMTSKTKENKE